MAQFTFVTSMLSAGTEKWGHLQRIEKRGNDDDVK